MSRSLLPSWRNTRRGFGADFDGIADLADLEFEVEGDDFGGADLDAGAEEFGEALGFGFDAVGAGVELGGAVIAAIGGGGGGGEAGRFVNYFDGDFGDGAT